MQGQGMPERMCGCSADVVGPDRATNALMLPPDMNRAPVHAGTGKLDLMGGCSADVVGLDWATDISAARAALGHSRPVQVGCISLHPYH